MYKLTYQQSIMIKVSKLFTAKNSALLFADSINRKAVIVKVSPAMRNLIRGEK